MVATLLNVLFGCRHKRLTRPITPVHKPGTRSGAAYVVCLECGKKFHYDVNNLRMGNAIDTRETITLSECRPFQAQY